LLTPARMRRMRLAVHGIFSTIEINLNKHRHDLK